MQHMIKIVSILDVGNFEVENFDKNLLMKHNNFDMGSGQSLYVVSWEFR